VKKRHGELPKLLDIGCQILRNNYSAWKVLDSRDLCASLAHADQHYIVRKSCVMTVLLYYRQEYLITAEIVHVVVGNVEDASLSRLCLHALFLLAATVMSGGHDVSPLTSDPVTQAVAPLLDIPD